MTRTQQEEQLIHKLKVQFNKLHAAGQLLVEIVKDIMPDDKEDKANALWFLEIVHELTTSIPRAYIQLLHDNGPESRDYPIYPFFLTTMENTMTVAWMAARKTAKVFKGGKKKLTDQLNTIELHIYSCAAIMSDLCQFQRTTMMVHKKTGIVSSNFPNEMEKEELDDYILIHPHLLKCDRKYVDAVYSCCTRTTSKKSKGEEVYTVPAKYWPKKGKRTYNSDEFKEWLDKVHVAICTSYDLSYNENL